MMDEEDFIEGGIYDDVIDVAFIDDPYGED